MRFLVAGLLLASAAAAQPAPTGRVIGLVTWDETAEPLIGANVWLVETPQGAATGIDGRFVIEDVPVGTHAVRVSYVGFVPAVTEVTVRAGETAWLAAALEEEAFDCGDGWAHCYDPVAHPRSAFAARRVVYDAQSSDRCQPTEGMTEAVAR